ncbi:MAG: tetratricopeptide repeat protein, partial [Candidatus Aegiribacteria sp.]|nr:tetratricopeptide repeat protein [Candidatus Aegiribacteria sp.]MBD3294918.1 tetratricopeptide repeat protein [Candidatus Fermentibacteria bacterium]
MVISGGEVLSLKRPSSFSWDLAANGDESRFSFARSQTERIHLLMQDAELFRRVEELHDSCRFEEALEMIRQEPPPHSFDFLKLKGRCLWRMGRLSEAETAYQAALALALNEDDQKKICDGYLGVGAMLFEQARYPEAVEVLQKGEASCRGRDIRKLMDILNWMGQAYHYLDMYDDAAGTYARALDLARKTDYPGSEAYLNSNAGLLQMSLGNHDSARDFFNEALRLQREEGNPFGEADAVSNIGISLFMEKKFDDAEPYLRKGMEAHRRAGAVYKQVLVGCSLANTLLELGKRTEALELMEDGLDTVKGMEDNLDLPAILSLAFDFYMKLEMSGKAGAVLRKTESFIASREVSLEELCQYNSMKARMARIENDPSAVYEYMSEALDLSFRLARKQNRILSDFLSMEKKTLQFKMEAKMARFQKFEGLGLLTAGIAHDFNNNLHSILGSINEIDREGSNPASVGNIRAAVSDAKNLCSQLLAFSGHASMDPRVIDINNELKDILQLL